MDCYEWAAEESRFVLANDPIEELTGMMGEDISRAGYYADFTSDDEVGVGAGITLYQHDGRQHGKPRFYISIMGSNAGVANVIAYDFPHLIQTLQQLQPLLIFGSLDQVIAGRSLERAEREEANN